MTERLDAFMARANAAYYARRDPFADFTTSPEISQVFGEIMGLWAAVCWQLLGSPTQVLLVEAGPGRGTLMADALRAIGQATPAFRAALQVHLIETSPRLRAAQAERVPDATWHDALDTVPAAPMLLIANEFLDALPIRQFVRRAGGWTERHVAEGRFVEEPADPADIPPGWGSPPDGTVREHAPHALAFVESVASRLVAHPGAALFADYGPAEDLPGESLQAIANGKPADALASPGEADLTAHVPFAALAQRARDAGARVHGPDPQGMVLARLGLFQRSNRLARSLPPAQAFSVMETARRLGEPDQMGRLFKMLAIAHPDLINCPGFDS